MVGLAVVLVLFACGEPAKSPAASPTPSGSLPLASVENLIVGSGSPPCEEPLAAGRRLFLETSPGIDPSGPEVHESLDFDGDGRNDAAVTFGPTCGSGGCNWWLFVRDGTCARFVGTLRGRELLPVRRESDGSLVVEVEEYAGSVQWSEQHARRDATGKYVVYQERTCEGRPRKPEPVCTAWVSPGGTQRP